MIRKEDLNWVDGDRAFTLNGWRFVTVHGGGYEDWAPGENCFLFFKTRALVEQYLTFFAGMAEPPRLDHVMELGLYDGGSVPFWFETLQPRKHVGLDIRTTGDNPYFEKYVSEHDRRLCIETHWGVSQDDRKRLTRLVDDAFGDQPLDLVIDDASHLYAPSRESFEILFPRLRPGGLYVIEDWAWHHWRRLEGEWRGRKPLTHLICELVEALGSTGQSLIWNLSLCSGFAAVRRGWGPAEGLAEGLDRCIYRHPR